MSYFASKDGKMKCTIIVGEMVGCCGAGIAYGMELRKFPSKYTAAQRNGYAREVYEFINYLAHDRDYGIMSITSLTSRGIRCWEDAYYQDGADHLTKFNLRHVAIEGGMKEGVRAVNPNTTNTIVMFTSPVTKPSDEVSKRERERVVPSYATGSW